MFSSNRHRWILEIIKGPDIVPAGKTAGHYFSKNDFSIATEKEYFTIDSAAVLDLSHSEHLIVRGPDSEFHIPWKEISRMDSEEPQEQTTSVLKPNSYAPVQSTVIPSPLGKKIG